MKCVIVSEDVTPIVGRHSSEEMGLLSINYDAVSVIRHGEEHTARKTAKAVSSIESMVATFPEVFDDGIGQFPGQATIQVKNDAVPAANVSCRVSPQVKQQLKKELHRLEERGVIAKIDEPKDGLAGCPFR